MNDNVKPFIHAPILAAWAADPEGVKIEIHIMCEDCWGPWHSDPGHAPSFSAGERYRATLRDGTVIESPEPKWVAKLQPDGVAWAVACEGHHLSEAFIYADAPDPEGTARMIAAKWNGEAPDRPHVPEGYEYMPDAVLPKPLTPEEIRSYSLVWVVGSTGPSSALSELAAEHRGALFYPTEEEAQQVFNAMRRRER